VSNPYATNFSPPTAPSKSGSIGISRTAMDYGEAFHYAMAHPNWIVNCLLLGLVHIIPVVGGILGPWVLLGYVYGDYEKYLRTGQTGPSEVKIEKFMDYIQRGIMPFLAALLCGIAVGFLAMVLAIPLFITFALLMHENEGLGIAVLVIGVLVMIAFNFFLSMLITPIVLRVGIGGKFEDVFNVGWAMSMVKKVWPQMIMSAIVSFAASLVLGLLGMLICGVGIIPVVGFLGYFNFQLQRQLYEIFVTEGGEPIPLPIESMTK
jgi:hypothetical protein